MSAVTFRSRRSNSGCSGTIRSELSLLGRCTRSCDLPFSVSRWTERLIESVPARMSMSPARSAQTSPTRSPACSASITARLIFFDGNRLFQARSARCRKAPRSFSVYRQGDARSERRRHNDIPPEQTGGVTLSEPLHHAQFLQKDHLFRPAARDFSNVVRSQKVLSPSAWKQASVRAVEERAVQS